MHAYSKEDSCHNNYAWRMCSVWPFSFSFYEMKKQEEEETVPELLN